MKIIQIEVTNYRLIKALMLELNGDNMAVTGKSGQGKTTAISLLWESLKMVGDPVTHGEKKGQIRITLGDGETEVFVTRSFTAKTAPITIVTSKGKSISAGAFADWFCGLGQNPHKIMDMKPKEQAQALLEAVKLPEGVDLGELDIKRAQAATERLNLGRDGERDLKALGTEPEHPEKVDIEALEKEEQAAALANKASDDLSASIQRSGDNMQIIHAHFTETGAAVNKLKAELIDAEEKLKGEEAILDAAQFTHDDLEKKLSALPPSIDTTAMREQIQEGHRVNNNLLVWENWNKRNLALDNLRNNYAEKDKEVKALDQAKKDALAAAEWPLEGLSVEDGTIIFNGSPLQQCGNSEQMLVCGALAAETISQHKLHVVRMDGIESMSPEDFKQLAKIFNDKGIQVLSSRVTRGDVDDGELLIVDGAIQDGET